jgi:type I restriction enzyme S subunit
MVLTPSPTLYPQYLQIFLSSPATVQALEGESVGSTMVNLNQKILLALDIFFPPLPEQTEIVRRVEALFAFADRIEARLAAAQATVARLTPATLAKAFRGELVPQDPDDEPAAVLLERIAALKDVTPAKKVRAKRPPRA